MATMTEAKKMVGHVVNTDGEVWGILEKVTADGVAFVKGPSGLAKVPVASIYADPT